MKILLDFCFSLSVSQLQDTKRTAVKRFIAAELPLVKGNHTGVVFLTG